MTQPDDHPAIQSVPLQRWTRANIEQTRDDLAVEEPLEIRVRGKAISVTMRTPGHDDELAVGFLLSEGLIQNASDISRIDPCIRAPEGNIINVFLAPHVQVDFAQLTRHVFASSSCGVCGKASIDAIRLSLPSVSSNQPFCADIIEQWPDTLRKKQAAFERTGGLHAAALFDANGMLIVHREDVGRHNAVDKVLGWAMQQPDVDTSTLALLVSGRASFEIVQKALAAQVPLIAAVSAPTSLAVELAQDSNQTLVGFLRPGRMNIYTHPERVV